MRLCRGPVFLGVLFWGVCTPQGGQTSGEPCAPCVIYQAGRTEDFQNLGKKVVLVGGCFDVLHEAHIRFLEKARASAGPEGRLVVALEPDSRIRHSKHREPVHDQSKRAHVLGALRIVDAVVLLPEHITSYEDYRQLVQDIHPDVIAVTAGDPQSENKKKQAQAVGAEVRVVMDHDPGYSSSQVVGSRPAGTFFSGKVGPGKGEARHLGCPTANLRVRTPLPRPGVHSAWVRRGPELWPALVWSSPLRPGVLEVHLYGFSGILTGETLDVYLQHFVRAPAVFASEAELRACIAEDMHLCKQLLDHQKRFEAAALPQPPNS